MDGLFGQVEEALRLGDAGLVHSSLDRVWMRLAVHIRAEHKILFPALAESNPEVQSQIQVLRIDHDFFMASFSAALQALRSPAPDIASVQVSVQAVRHRLAAHNAFEESRIYPMVDMLPSNQRQNLMEGLKREMAFLPERYQRT